MNSYFKEATVGLLVLVGAAIFVFGTLWLRGRSVGSPDVEVLFVDIGNLKEGAPVQVSGAPVGRVSEIEFMGVKRVRVGLVLSPVVAMTKNAIVTITPVGMLGDVAVSLAPGVGPLLAPGDTIAGRMSAGLLDNAAPLMDQATTTMKSLNRMLDTNLVIQLRRTLTASEKLLNYLADTKTGPTAELSATMRSFQATTARLDSTLMALDVKRIQGGLDSTLRTSREMMNRLSVATGRMDSIMMKLQRGEGTMGKLMNDTMLYTDLRAMMQSTTKLIDALAKNPGMIGITVRIP